MFHLNEDLAKREVSDTGSNPPQAGDHRTLLQLLGWMLTLHTHQHRDQIVRGVRCYVEIALLQLNWDFRVVVQSLAIGGNSEGSHPSSALPCLRGSFRPEPQPTQITSPFANGFFRSVRRVPERSQRTGTYAYSEMPLTTS